MKIVVVTLFPEFVEHALQFGDASLHKVTGMPARRLFRGRTVVNLFHRNVAAGNAMIFNSGETPFWKRGQFFGR